MIYLDANIFLYRSNITDPQHDDCKKLLDFVEKNSLEFTSSVETIQEIIHYMQRLKELEAGIKISHQILKQIRNPIAIDIESIRIYLQLVDKYRTSDSRDVLHLAICIRSAIQTIITYDKGFRIFKEVHALTPAEYLARVV